jgi:hypothetical protein
MLRLSAHILTWIGWSLAVISLFLPVSRTLESAGTLIGTPLVGWEALMAITENLFNFWFWLILIADPAAQWLPFLAAATLLLLVMPPVLSAADEQAGCLQVPFGAVPVVLWLLPSHVQSGMCWGVWVWAAAFVLVSVGGLVRTLAAAADGV